jgi:hypothetical protein
MAKKKAASGAGKKGAKSASPKTSPKKSLQKKAAKGALAKAKRKPSAKGAKTPSKKPASLGRPKVTAEEKLFMLFREDYHARQIFEFLRTETVRDLEQWSPDEIVRLLSKPIRQSVERIRVKLAEHNRCLRDDEIFALEHGSGSE